MKVLASNFRSQNLLFGLSKYTCASREILAVDADRGGQPAHQIICKAARALPMVAQNVIGKRCPPLLEDTVPVVRILAQPHIFGKPSVHLCRSLDNAPPAQCEPALSEKSRDEPSLAAACALSRRSNLHYRGEPVSSLARAQRNTSSESITRSNPAQRSDPSSPTIHILTGSVNP